MHDHGADHIADAITRLHVIVESYGYYNKPIVLYYKYDS